MTAELHKIISFLDIHAGAMTAIFTLTLTLATFFMWLEMYKSRKRLDKPNIQIYFEPQARWGNFFNLVVANLGNVSVYDLTLSIEPPIRRSIQFLHLNYRSDERHINSGIKGEENGVRYHLLKA